MKDEVRFEYEIQEDKQIKIKVNGRDWAIDKDNKFIDTFTQIAFTIEPKEILEIQRLMTSIAFDWCNKFKCRLDAPACH